MNIAVDLRLLEKVAVAQAYYTVAEDVQWVAFALGLYEVLGAVQTFEGPVALQRHFDLSCHTDDC